MYYQAMGDIGEIRYHEFCDRHDFNYHHYDGLPFPVSSINDGIICYMGHSIPFEEKRDFYTVEFANTVKDGIGIMQKAYDIFTELQGKLSNGYSKALQKQWRWQAYYWMNLFAFAKENCEAIEEFALDKIDRLSFHYEQAASFVKNILLTRKAWYTGEWANWFSDERKLDLQRLYDFCLQEKERFKKMAGNE